MYAGRLEPPQETGGGILADEVKSSSLLNALSVSTLLTIE
jgi:hypothetical protein